MVDEQFDAAGDAGLPSDQAGPLQGEHHLVDGWAEWRGNRLQVAFGGRPSVDRSVGPDKCEALALLFGDAGEGVSQIFLVNGMLTIG